MNKSNENFLIVQNAVNFSQKEAYSALYEDFDDIKPMAILKIETIENPDEADILIHHLTNHSNPTREAAAFALLEHACGSNINFFMKEKNIEILCNAISDINPNVCRTTISLISSFNVLKEAIYPLIVQKICALLEDFKIFEKEAGNFSDNKIKSRKNHARNKKLFNLYWYLEALAEILENTLVSEEIIEIVRESSDFLDYTIREKAAKILIKIKNSPPELLQKLKNDENFYVKNLVYDKIIEDSKL